MLKKGPFSPYIFAPGSRKWNKKNYKVYSMVVLSYWISKLMSIVLSQIIAIAMKYHSFSCVEQGASRLGCKLLPICPTVYQQAGFTLCPKVNTNLYQCSHLLVQNWTGGYSPSQTTTELHDQLSYSSTQNQSNCLQVSKKFSLYILMYVIYIKAKLIFLYFYIY